jgi:hypothetical protein
MAKRLADDIRASLHEALDHAVGKRTKAIVHKVIPRKRATNTKLSSTRHALAKSSAAH